MTEEATQYCVAIGRISKLRPVQEHQPLFRLVPQYPGELLIAGVEGHVDFEFTVDEDGFVRDPRVINAMSTVGTAAKSTGSRLTRSVGKTNLLFEKAALEALERFRYAPMFVDGVATPVQNVQTRISFQIED